MLYNNKSFTQYKEVFVKFNKHSFLLIAWIILQYYNIFQINLLLGNPKNK